jgi:spore photoproduct lyase
MQKTITRNFFKIKKDNFSTRERIGLKILPNGRSADYIIPNIATGCETVGCAYCYVSRNNKEGNPLTLYTNLDQIIDATIKHHQTLPPKISNQCDSLLYTYDIGEATDCLTPLVIQNTNKVILKLTEQNIKPTFATKLGHHKNIEKLINVKPNSARVRMSLMPQELSSILELGSSSIISRIEGIEYALEKGYEVHVNFSPIIITKTWLEDYKNLFHLIDQKISNKAKEQLKAEVIFLTHDIKAHQHNLKFNAEGEKYLWRPELQEEKTNNRNSSVLRYKFKYKNIVINKFKQLFKEHMPYCTIRYIF